KKRRSASRAMDRTEDGGTNRSSARVTAVRSQWIGVEDNSSRNRRGVVPPEMASSALFRADKAFASSPETLFARSRANACGEENSYHLTFMLHALVPGAAFPLDQGDRSGGTPGA